MERIVEGELNINELKKRELERVRGRAKIEFSWWQDKLITNSGNALREGVLVECPTVGEGFRLIGPLRNKTEPNLLLPQTLGLLRMVASVWRDELSEQESFLSVTSLYRTAELQSKLINEGANAALISTHQAGAAIDFDPTAYYLSRDFKSVNYRNAVGFNPKHPEVLTRVLERLQHIGLCNFIVERSYKTTENQQVVEYDSCYHVCVVPDKFI